MTKVEATKQVLIDNGGISSWPILYNQIEKYYPEIKSPKDWKAALRGVIYRENKNGKNFKMLDNALICLLDYDENNLVLKEDRLITTKSIEVKIRIGQNKFRENLLKHLKKCPITGLDDKRLLIASHIKPWAISSDKDRLDINNGFIFSPTVDKLFDLGLITFEQNKKLIISKSVSQNNVGKIGIEDGKIYDKLPIEGRLEYLEFHRNNIFIKE